MASRSHKENPDNLGASQSNISKILRQDVSSDVISLFEDSGLQLPKSVHRALLALFNGLYNYQEEGKRFRPTVLIGNALKESLSVVPNKQIITLASGAVDSTFDCRKVLKPVIPLSEAGWIPTLEFPIAKGTFAVSIVTAFNGIHGQPITDILWSNEPPNGMVEVSATDGHRITLRGVRTVILDNSLIKLADSGGSFPPRFLYDISKDIKARSKVRLPQVMRRLFNLMQQRVGGCLIGVYSKSLKKAPFKDGIWLEEPLSLADISKQCAESTERRFEQGLFSAIALATSMLNVDGLTIIDSAGRLRGYNYFVPSGGASIDTERHSGGARARAAKFLLDSTDERLQGVFFRSHDGGMYYKRRKRK